MLWQWQHWLDSDIFWFAGNLSKFGRPILVTDLGSADADQVWLAFNLLRSRKDFLTFCNASSVVQNLAHGFPNPAGKFHGVSSWSMAWRLPLLFFFLISRFPFPTSLPLVLLSCFHMLLAKQLIVIYKHFVPLIFPKNKRSSNFFLKKRTKLMGAKSNPKSNWIGFGAGTRKPWV